MPLLDLGLTIVHPLAQVDLITIALVSTAIPAHSYKPEHSLRPAVLHSKEHGIKQGTTLSLDILLHQKGNMMRKYLTQMGT